jgi:hypothetical protein
MGGSVAEVQEKICTEFLSRKGPTKKYRMAFSLSSLQRRVANSMSGKVMPNKL